MKELEIFFNNSPLTQVVDDKPVKESCQGLIFKMHLYYMHMIFPMYFISSMYIVDIGLT